MMTSRAKSVGERLVISAKTDNKRIHITPRSNGWAIRKEAKLRAFKLVPTQKEAIEIARPFLSTGKASIIVVHSKSGKYRIIK